MARSYDILMTVTALVDVVVVVADVVVCYFEWVYSTDLWDHGRSGQVSQVASRGAVACPVRSLSIHPSAAFGVLRLGTAAGTRSVPRASPNHDGPPRPCQERVPATHTHTHTR